jgi:hypothetical protein
MKKLNLILSVSFLATSGFVADAKPIHDPRPSAWCGWWMRQHVGHDPGVAFNVARNWAHWGVASSPRVGAIVVWPHHVGVISGRSNGEWIVLSGNDGHQVRNRPRSLSGVIAVRWE